MRFIDDHKTDGGEVFFGQLCGLLKRDEDNSAIPLPSLECSLGIRLAEGETGDGRQSFDDFLKPIFDQRSRADDKVVELFFVRDRMGDGGQGLDSFPQTHLVTQQRLPDCEGEFCSELLIWPDGFHDQLEVEGLGLDPFSQVHGEKGSPHTAEDSCFFLWTSLLGGELLKK